MLDRPQGRRDEEASRPTAEAAHTATGSSTFSKEQAGLDAQSGGGREHRPGKLEKRVGLPSSHA